VEVIWGKQQNRLHLLKKLSSKKYESEQKPMFFANEVSVLAHAQRLAVNVGMRAGL